jgi:hypothetical protein
MRGTMGTLNRSSIVAYSASVRVDFCGDPDETKRLAIKGSERWPEMTLAFFHHLTDTTKRNGENLVSNEIPNALLKAPNT